MSEWDRDGDGIPNIVEELRGTNPDRADTDGDTVSDGDEIDLGWDPTKADPQARVDQLRASLDAEHEKLDRAWDDARDMFRDSDGDGLDDHTERKLGTDPWNVDTDRDGLSDAFEVQYGLDPKDNLPDPPEPAPHVPMRLDDSIVSSPTVTPGAAPPESLDDLHGDDSPAVDVTTSFDSAPPLGIDLLTNGDDAPDPDPGNVSWDSVGQPVDDRNVDTFVAGDQPVDDSAVSDSTDTY